MSVRINTALPSLVLLIVIAIVSLQFTGTLVTPLSAQSNPLDCQLTLSAWTNGAQAPTNHLEAGVATVNGKLYVFAGFADGSITATNRVDVYNVANNTWETATTPRRPMPVSISHIT
ncbi:MAG: hypothetical protein H7Y11_05610, partial [Armatimonadetes bacterium]|nr:hypothetical protein [Anaerolineae bacterium]